jgi:hypothetical protein
MTKIAANTVQLFLIVVTPIAALVEKRLRAKRNAGLETEFAVSRRDESLLRDPFVTTLPQVLCMFELSALLP